MLHLGLCRYAYKLGHRFLNGTYIWNQMYQFKSSPYPGQNSLQRVVIFGDMGKVCDLFRFSKIARTSIFHLILIVFIYLESEKLTICFHYLFVFLGYDLCSIMNFLSFCAASCYLINNCEAFVIFPYGLSSSWGRRARKSFYQ